MRNIYKKILLIFIIIFGIIPIKTHAEQTTKLYIDAQRVDDSKIFLEKSSLSVSSDIVEQFFNTPINISNDKNIVFMEFNNEYIKFIVDELYYEKNYEKIPISTPVRYVQDKYFIPVRELSTIFSKKLQYFPKFKLIMLGQEFELKTHPFDNRNIKKTYKNYDNTSIDWYFIPTKKTHQGIKTGINKNISNLISRYNVIWQAPKEEKTVYITFDEGYEYKNNTSKILDIASKKGVKFTFFVTGHYLDSNKNLVKRMHDEGHLVANHSNNHLNAPKALNVSNEKFMNDLVAVEEKYKKITGKNISPYYRPPEGVYSQRTLKIADDMGYKTVFWSFAYQDWLTNNQPYKKYALDKIVGQLHNGSVILLHTVSSTNVSILEELIDTIKIKGYKIETLDKI